MLAPRARGGMGGHTQRGQDGTSPGPNKVGPRVQFRTAQATDHFQTWHRRCWGAQERSEATPGALCETTSKGCLPEESVKSLLRRRSCKAGPTGGLAVLAAARRRRMCRGPILRSGEDERD